ncbi:hypothetical protein BDN72DRAFT_836001 [Pluteus cervinus]|uniref:Uncharacterized protein n=1 Tax=Pluteus cervinus TaxID=181527 RepID=A0ACD3B4F4_9AGAR|nr:hypothetical protein BDN72DRAFT_836001 [Pluteus cervinus]
MTDTQIAPSPRLAPELEYAIFMTAIKSDAREAKNLVPIAKRVFDWLIPYVFHVVELDTERPVPITFNQSAFKRYGKHTRHLFLGRGSGQGKYIHLFPNVTNIVFWTGFDKAYLPALLQLPLTRISTEFTPQLFQVFQRITHFDLFSDEITMDATFESQLYLPKLTHLCVLPELSPEVFELFLNRVRCPELGVVILWGSSSSGRGFPELDGNWAAPVDEEDGRIVRVRCIPRVDWRVGARGGVDMWEFAERVLASRKGQDTGGLV